MINLDDYFSDFSEEETVKQTEDFFDKLEQEYPSDVDLDKHADMRKALTSENLPKDCLNIPTIPIKFMIDTLFEMGEKIPSRFCSDYDIHDENHVYIGSLREFSKIYFGLVFEKFINLENGEK